MSCRIHIDIDDDRQGGVIIELDDNSDTVDECYDSIMRGLGVQLSGCKYVEIRHA